MQNKLKTGVRKLFLRVLNVLKYLTFLCGILFLLLAALAFTRIPFDAHRWLGEKNSAFKFSPDIIVMLGGGGMPSESNLIRLFYTCELSIIYPDADIIIAHPIDVNVAGNMGNFLIKSGVDSSRISYMLNGTNTREQGIELIQFRKNIQNSKVAIVTSPENMYRTIRVFHKLGFSQTGGAPAFENAMFVDLSYNHQKIGGEKFAPDVSQNLDLRYNFWNYLKLEITCLREYVAIMYYKLNGWI